MYPKYFGLNEPGFSITPDPQYLFLSRQHREALAHLSYGTGDSGGFVLLTGEVGTGKTTVCRAFLDHLPEHVDVALIFNPALNGRELLEAVCREFGLAVPRRQMSTHDLLDLLNTYLLDVHAKGRRPVLIIDEAQNLSPEVLEQVRLLTNLETNKHKLLQIFLIGQPELRDLLEERRVRQVAQRITARYHLTPLRPSETRDYIRHRLRVAGAGRELFTRWALRRVHRLSGGIPRLINILCDRALLGAYATGQQGVDWGTVGRAARELRGEGTPRSVRWRHALSRGAMAAGYLTLLLGAAGLGVLAAKVYPFSGSFPELLFGSITSADPDRVPTAPESALGSAPSVRHPSVVAPLLSDQAPAEPVLPPAVEDPPGDQVPPAALQPAGQEGGAGVAESATDEAMKPSSPLVTDVASLLSSRGAAMERLLATWGVEYSASDGRNPCRVAESNGLRCRELRGGVWADLRKYGRPALLHMRLADGREGDLVVTGLGSHRVRIGLAEGSVDVPSELLQRDWDGELLLLWKPPVTGDRLIGRGASSGSIAWLRETLARASPESLVLTEVAQPDWPLKAAVVHFQQAEGLDPDGIAGPDTIIRLNTLSERPNIPRIRVLPD
jgi:general secretion pathway protein A